MKKLLNYVRKLFTPKVAEFRIVTTVNSVNPDWFKSAEAEKLILNIRKNPNINLI